MCKVLILMLQILKGFYSMARESLNSGVPNFDSELRSVLRSHEDRSHWCVLSRQIIPNKGGLSSLFTLWPRVRGVA